MQFNLIKISWIIHWVAPPLAGAMAVSLADLIQVALMKMVRVLLAARRYLLCKEMQLQSVAVKSSNELLLGGGS